MGRMWAAKLKRLSPFHVGPEKIVRVTFFVGIISAWRICVMKLNEFCHLHGEHWQGLSRVLITKDEITKNIFSKEIFKL
jgi:hypothetical protein